MSKTKLALVAASVVMAFAASAAHADVVYAPQSPVSIKVATGQSGFTQNFNFKLDGDSLISAAQVVLKSSGTTSALKSLTATLFYQTATGWTSLWTDSTSFTKSQGVGTWATSFDNVAGKAGNYKLSLSGLVFANTSYSGSYQYQVSVAPVPEPETYALMGLGLAALLLRRKQKKAANSFSLAV
ncbi:FxDxF family PEP-CTERM protein [Aquitalea sp.]|uniref:FxDxF family PEP-CTERM protein n=1 Tax=Aquitalea sp. TaxID=1872623 RepID=UPI00258FD95B|nr:FxDxF family PEP-CTERM protein [Aquitalea sp.]